MLLQHLRYLVALARERHFARAADACQVAQPTLSEGIRQLEEDLGVPIVERRQRYQGLTHNGVSSGSAPSHKLPHSHLDDTGG
jgi:DNA-binding transcriptional LysR family regulator